MESRSAERVDLDALSHLVIGSALRIHTRLGPGLFESVYHSVLHRDLVKCGLFVESNKLISFEFEGEWFENGFRTDLIVERCLVVEIKSIAAIAPVHERQLLTYLRLLDYKLGLLINFNNLHLKDGIKRVVNNY